MLVRSQQMLSKAAEGRLFMWIYIMSSQKKSSFLRRKDWWWKCGRVSPNSIRQLSIPVAPPNPYSMNEEINLRGRKMINKIGNISGTQNYSCFFWLFSNLFYFLWNTGTFICSLWNTIKMKQTETEYLLVHNLLSNLHWVYLYAFYLMKFGQTELWTNKYDRSKPQCVRVFSLFSSYTSSNAPL